jgi:hypothetical protein
MWCAINHAENFIFFFFVLGAITTGSAGATFSQVTKAHHGLY